MKERLRGNGPDRRQFLAAAAGVLTACSGDSPAEFDSQQETAKMALDYSRSYVTFVTEGRGNLARLQVESRCSVYDAEGTLLEEFFQYASCKSEDTHGTGVLFYEVNYDFSGVFSKENYVIYRARAPWDDRPYHDRGKVADRFEDLLFQIEEASEVKALETVPQIVEATLVGHPLVGRTEITSGDGMRAVIEYPVKTMNVNEKPMYQVDTGPLAFPDFDVMKEGVDLVDSIELAYVAYNKPDEAYFVIQRQSPVAPGNPKGPKVCHYSDIRRFDAKNSLVAVVSG